ncbi:Snf7 family protein [Kipferlia bialata]|uniref:Snf7 family protein n=1 Tax=Kipferlia bialata TaxID=797122 RepID=A0A9K3D4U7_9EUKA|nr:Snf7 family protein [Kipferlia bialata]|eukprot:g10120.t1
MGLFGKRQTMAEQLRNNKRMIDRAIRQLDSERRKMEQQEARTVRDIQQAAQKGQENVARIHAKDLVRTRNFVQRFVRMRASLSALSLRMQTMNSMQSMNAAMGACTRLMGMMNNQTDVHELRSVMRDFEKATEKMDMKEEMVNEMMDDVFEEEDDAEEQNAVIDQVYTELGINFSNELGGVAVRGQVCVVSITLLLYALRDA